MNRCNPHPTPCLHRAPCLFALRLLALSLLAGGALGQTGPTRQQLTTTTDGTVVEVRTFPAQAVRGTLTVLAPPEVSLDGKAERLSPGSRIRAANGMLAMSGSLLGQTLPVMYTRESHGLLHDIWVLTAAEAELRPIKPAYSQ